MKKLLTAIALVLFAFTGLYSETGDWIRDEPVFYEPEYESYNSTFTPLSGKEKLSVEYKDGNRFKLLVYRGTSEKKELLGEWDGIEYGHARVSNNGKKLIFELDKPYYKPLIIINGNTGKITYYFTCVSGLIVDKNLDYIIAMNTDYASFFSNPEGEEVDYPYFIVRIADRKIIQERTWTLKNNYGNLSFWISDIDDYDFIIYYMVESFVEAEAYYNVEKELFTVTYPQGKPYDLHPDFNPG